MADAIFWQLLESVQTGIRSLTFSTQTGDTVPVFANSAVVIRKLAFREDDAKADRSEQRPGVIISPVNAITPPNKGTNERDDTTYIILVQIIDDDPTFRTENLKTYLKWQEQIRKYFQSSARSDVQTDAGYANFGFSTSQNVVDDRLYPLHKLFVGGLQLEFDVRETRGATI